MWFENWLMGLSVKDVQCTLMLLLAPLIYAQGECFLLDGRNRKPL
jgi:predicted component of type VI protein secretion system